MPWVTVIWSMAAAACLTLAAIYGLAWYRNRTAWARLLFSLTAASTTAFAFCELWLMRAETPGELLTALQWGHATVLFLVVSIIWFVRFYLRAGRLWLAWTLCGLRVFYLLPGLLLGQGFMYREISLGQVPLLGDDVTVFTGTVNPWMLIGHALNFMMVIFVADASVTAWRRGERRQALIVGGAVEFLIILGTLESALIYWAHLPIPILLSPFYLGLVAVMGYELSRDVLRASQLVDELQVSESGLRESEARMSLAVDAADLGIWIRDLVQHNVWASEKWRALFGFGPSEPLEFSAIVNRLHPDDREALQQAHARAVAGADGGRYQTEYRVMLPHGAIRWMSSQGRVERDATGQAVLIRGVTRDITAGKHAELVLRDLSGRLIAAQEVERARIARDLHDDVSQQLAALAIALSGFKHRAMTVPDGMTLQNEVSSLQERTIRLSESVRDLSHDLHPDVLRHAGLAASLTDYCNGLTRPQELAVTCSTEGDFESIAPEAALCLYRIAQEALHNVVKHAHAHEARVQLIRTGDKAELTIADDGKGFDVRTRNGAGLGLVSITERARLLGGTVSIVTTLNEGTQIRVRIPINASTTTDAGEQPERVTAST